MSLLDFITQSWEAAVYLMVTLWAGYALGQISAHFWYYNHFQKTLKRRIHQPSSQFDTVQGRLAEEGEKRLELLDRQAVESDVRLFSAALVAGFAYYLREYFLDW